MTSIVSIIAPEFADVNLQDFVDLASSEVKSNIQDRDKIVAYLACHYATIALKQKGASGEVTSVTEGKLNITYANNIKNSDNLSSTSYGREYKRLLNKNIFRNYTY